MGCDEKGKNTKKIILNLLLKKFYKICDWNLGIFSVSIVGNKWKLWKRKKMPIFFIVKNVTFHVAKKVIGKNT